MQKLSKLFYINVIEQNAGWGSEVFINNGFNINGVQTITLDYRKHRATLLSKYQELTEDFDALLLQRGDGFPLELLRAVKRPRFFWASELISRNRDQDRLLSSGLFNHIFVHSDACKKTAVEKFGLLPEHVSVLLNGFDETVHKSLNIVKKDIDVLFVGNYKGLKHRCEVLEKLTKTHDITISDKAFGPQLTQVFNRAKIVLNIHSEDFLDTETRVFEALGCGAFLLSEKLSTENPFTPGVHYAEAINPEDMAEKIKYYIEREAERSVIASAGHAEAITNHTYTKRAFYIASVIELYLPSIQEGKSIDLNKSLHAMMPLQEIKMDYRQFNLGNYVVPEDARNGICVDIGANVGSFLQKYHTFFKQIQFYEPQTQCYSLCTTFNRPNIIGYKEAVYSKCDETFPLIAHTNHESGSSALDTDTINKDWSTDIIEYVSTVDLETVLKRVGGYIDYLKIDCETGEYHFFIGKDLSNIKYIGMEPHWQMGKEKYDALFQHIQKTHYLVGSSTWVEAPSSNIEVLFINKSTLNVKPLEQNNIEKEITGAVFDAKDFDAFLKISGGSLSKLEANQSNAQALQHEYKQYLGYKKDLQQFSSLIPNSSDKYFPSIDGLYPCLTDKTINTSFDRHYMYHMAWAARILATTKPESHIDISSSLVFSALVSAFIPVKFYDYRPPKLDLPNFQTGQADLLKLPFDSDSISSLSCMHVIEHIGLGRYGDALDPDGFIKAIQELKRCLAIEGDLLFVVPIGKPKLLFNAHRVFSYDQIMSYFPDCTLVKYSLIPDNEDIGIISNASKAQTDDCAYGCGCFWFKKKERKKVVAESKRDIEKLYYELLKHPTMPEKDQLFEEAFLRAENNKQVNSEWSLSKNALKALINKIDDKKFINILEFGAGFSTVFFHEYFGSRLYLDSFEQHKEYAEKLESILGEGKGIKIHNTGLKQYSNEDFMSLMKNPTFLSLYTKGEKVPVEQYNNTRITNTFYELDSLENHYDAMIVDGPHGNGRSLAFAVAASLSVPVKYILIDDLDHYPFLSDCADIFRFKILKAETYPFKSWALLEVTGRR